MDKVTKPFAKVQDVELAMNKIVLMLGSFTSFFIAMLRVRAQFGKKFITIAPTHGRPPIQKFVQSA